MDSLAVEVLEAILSFLDESDLNAAERVCSHWSQVVVARFWWHRLNSLATSGDSHLRNIMLKDGFRDGASWNHAVNRRLFLKIRSCWKDNWRSAGPLDRRDHILRKCSAADFCAQKMSGLLPYKDKMFFALERGAVEVWTMGDASAEAPHYKSMLYTGAEAAAAGLDLGYLPRGYCLDIWSRNLVAIDCSRRKILVFDAEEEIRVGEVSSPVGNVYAVGVTSKLLLCLSGWHLIAWEYELQNSQLHLKAPFVASDFSEPLAAAAAEHNMAWIDVHHLEKSEKYVVTLPSARSTGNGSQSSKSSLVRVRRCDNLEEQFVLLSRSGEEEISRIKLSPDNLLAVLELLKSETVLRVINVDTRETMFSLPSLCSPLALVHLPIQWVNDRLFFKRVPHANEEDVSLMAVDILSGGNAFQVRDLRMRTPNDLLHASNFRLIYQFNSFPVTAVGQAQEFQIRLGVMDFL